MAFPKKGKRKIEIEGVQYLFKISKIKQKSNWRIQENELDNTFMKYASYYGLGKVKDATINIAVQLAFNPVSNLYVKCYTLIVDGFMGPEQIIEITPSMVLKLVNKSIKDGWKPNQKGDFRMEIAQKWTKSKKPTILQLPDMNAEIENYENKDKSIERLFSEL